MVVHNYPCTYDASEFVRDFSQQPPIFLPDTTPVVSHAAFQLLAFAMQQNATGDSGTGDFSEVLQNSVLGPLNMTNSGLLSKDLSNVFAADGLNLSQIGEPA